MINFLLTQTVRIPKPMHRTGSTMKSGRFSGVEYIKYKATLLRIRLTIKPIHIPIQKRPALGK